MGTQMTLGWEQRHRDGEAPGALEVGVGDALAEEL